MKSELRSKILTQLARTEGTSALQSLESEAATISAKLDTETRFDVLEEQIDLLGVFAFRVPETTVTIVNAFIERMDSLKLTHADNIGWAKTDLERYGTKERLLVKILELLNRIRYFDIIGVLKVFLEQSKSEHADVKKAADEGLGSLSEYNINVYYSGENRAGIGAAPQVRIVEYLEGLDGAAMARNLDAITTLCHNILSSEMQGTEWDYKSVTWSRSSVPADQKIREVRSRALKILELVYSKSGQVGDKSKILNAMINATRRPHSVMYDDDVVDMVVESTLEVLKFFRAVLPGERLQIVQKVEHFAYWLFRNSPNDNVKASAIEIRDRIAKNSEYEIYNDLIGFEGVYGDWEDSSETIPDFEGIDAYRTKKAMEYAESIADDNWPEWRERIIRFATSESSDLATFPKFFEFLRAFAEQSPDLAYELLTEELERIEGFIIPLLRGLWVGPRKADLRSLMMGWISEGRELEAVSRLFWSNKNIDDELLVAALDRATSAANADALTTITGVAVSNFEGDRRRLISTLFLPAVAALNRMGNTNWAHDLWFRSELREIVGSLDGSGREIILNGLLQLNEIEHHAEELLRHFAESDPERILNFFHERLERKRIVESEFRYDAIPFQFSLLHETLAKTPELAVNTVRRWFDGDYASFRFRGANLLRIIFPNFSDAFEDKLLELVRSGSELDIKFVISVLQDYEGETFLNEICKQIIIMLPKDSDLIPAVSSVLLSTGTVVGEFGFAEAYEEKIEEAAPWLSDKNANVRQFAEEHVAYLKAQAARERSRAEEEIVLRKHRYGVHGDETDDSSATDGD